MLKDVGSDNIENVKKKLGNNSAETKNMPGELLTPNEAGIIYNFVS